MCPGQGIGHPSKYDETGARNPTFRFECVLKLFYTETKGNVTQAIDVVRKYPGFIVRNDGGRGQDFTRHKRQNVPLPFS